MAKAFIIPHNMIVFLIEAYMVFGVLRVSDSEQKLPNMAAILSLWY